MKNHVSHVLLCEAAFVMQISLEHPDAYLVVNCKWYKTILCILHVLRECLE